MCCLPGPPALRRKDQPVATDSPYCLDEIADRLAIEQVIARYVHALDARDYDTLDDVFLPDARFDLTEAGGIAGPWVEVKRYYQATVQVTICRRPTAPSALHIPGGRFRITIVIISIFI
jgi:SnoaL-like domain